MPSSASDTLRQQPPVEDKSGLEELTAQLQDQHVTSVSVGTPLSAAGLEELKPLGPGMIAVSQTGLAAAGFSGVRRITWVAANPNSLKGRGRSRPVLNFC